MVNDSTPNLGLPLPSSGNFIEEDLPRLRDALTGIDAAVAGVQSALPAKADLVGGMVPASQLPSFVDDVIEVANYAALPATGEAGKIYVTLDNNYQYRWGGSTWVEVGKQPGLATAGTPGLVKIGSGIAVAGDGTISIPPTSFAYGDYQLTITSNGQTAFTIMGGYTPGALDVHLNGSQLTVGSDFAASDGSTLTLASGVNTTDELVIRRWVTFSVPDAILKSGDSMAGALNEAPATTMAAGATAAIGDANANTINLTGSAVVTSFGSAAAGVKRRLIFSGACTLTHNATSLILPGAANITTAAGDVAELLSMGGGNWKCLSFAPATANPASQKPLAMLKRTWLANGFTAGVSNLQHVFELDSSRRCLIYGGGSGSTFVYSAVIYDGASATFGTPVAFYTGATDQTIAVVKIDSGRVLVFYQQNSSTTSAAVVLSCSGTTITVGTPVSKTLATTGPLSQVAATCGSSYVFGQQGYLYAITVSGTVPTIGNAAALTGSGDVLYALHSISSTELIAQCGRSSPSQQFVVTPFTVSGTTLTRGTEATAASTNSGFAGIATKLSTGRFACSYVNTQVYGAIFTASGNVATISSVRLGAGTYASGYNFCPVGDKVVVRTATGSVNVLTDNAGTATAGTELAVGMCADGYTPWIACGADWVATANDSTSTSIYVIDVSGSSAVIKRYYASYSGAVVCVSQPPGPTNQNGSLAKGSKYFSLNGISGMANTAFLRAVFDSSGNLDGLVQFTLPVVSGTSLKEPSSQVFWMGYSLKAPQIELQRWEIT